jgi:hypothetical protein
MIPKPRHLEPEYGAQFKEGMLEFQVTANVIWGIPQEFTENRKEISQ